MMQVKVERTGSLFSATAIEAIMNEEVKVYLTDASKRLERAVFEKLPHNTGVTRGALFSGIRGIAQGRGESFVSLPVEHAEALEMGSKPHWPPIAPIMLWAEQRYRDKGGSVRMIAKTIKKERKLRTQKDAVKSFAYAVQAAIAKRGTKALKMFARSKADLDPDLLTVRWPATLERIAKRLSE